MKKFAMNYDKNFLRKRLGSMSQLGGLKKYRLSNGRGDGVEAVDVRTGAGLSYTVLPGRGMDIAKDALRSSAGRRRITRWSYLTIILINRS